MSRKRAGKTVTFSISVDPETQRLLKEEAARSFDGNVSALVAALAKEVRRQAAFRHLLRGVTISDEEREEFLVEMRGKPAPKKRRRAA